MRLEVDSRIVDGTGWGIEDCSLDCMADCFRIHCTGCCCSLDCSHNPVRFLAYSLLGSVVACIVNIILIEHFLESSKEFFFIDCSIIIGIDGLDSLKRLCLCDNNWDLKCFEEIIEEKGHFVDI